MTIIHALAVWVAVSLLLTLVLALPALLRQTSGVGYELDSKVWAVLEEAADR